MKLQKSWQTKVADAAKSALCWTPGKLILCTLHLWLIPDHIREYGQCDIKHKMQLKQISQDTKYRVSFIYTYRHRE